MSIFSAQIILYDDLIVYTRARKQRIIISRACYAVNEKNKIKYYL